jgi:uncharacterized membrane protein
VLRDPSIPRLANDTTRAWVASGFSMAVSFATTFAYIRYSIGGNRQFILLLGVTYTLLAGMLVFFVLYEWLTWRTFRRADPGELARWVHGTRPRAGRGVLMRALSDGGAASWSVQAALLSLLAVVLISFPRVLREDLLVVGLGLLLVVSGWLMVAVSYAVGYLRHNVEAVGLEFPGAQPLVWADYLYLSVQVCATFSTSDVTVLDTTMRRRVTSQTLIAFVFNTVIVALLVSALLTLQ